MDSRMCDHQGWQQSEWQDYPPQCQYYSQLAIWSQHQEQYRIYDPVPSLSSALYLTSSALPVFCCCQQAYSSYWTRSQAETSSQMRLLIWLIWSIVLGLTAQPSRVLRWMSCYSQFSQSVVSKAVDTISCSASSTSLTFSSFWCSYLEPSMYLWIGQLSYSQAYSNGFSSSNAGYVIIWIFYSKIVLSLKASCSFSSSSWSSFSSFESGFSFSIFLFSTLSFLTSFFAILILLLSLPTALTVLCIIPPVLLFLNDSCVFLCSSSTSSLSSLVLWSLRWDSKAGCESKCSLQTQHLMSRVGARGRRVSTSLIFLSWLARIINLNRSKGVMSKYDG